MFQQPIDDLPTKQSVRVREVLRDLLQTGDIDSYVNIKDKMVHLTVPTMLKPPFGIHYQGSIPGIEISKLPGELLSLRLKTTDLQSSLAARFPDPRKEPQPKSYSEATNDALHWLVRTMRSAKEAGGRLTKTYCKTEVIRLYKIRVKTFQELWPIAMREAGVKWSKPGRFNHL
jgi:hypothetical protein